MIVHYANIHFHSWDEVQKVFDNEEQKNDFEFALSSDARFIKIDWDLYAISSISAVNFLKTEKIKRTYEELSEDNKKKFDENPNIFPLYEITKSIWNTNK